MLNNNEIMKALGDKYSLLLKRTPVVLFKGSALQKTVVDYSAAIFNENDEIVYQTASSDPIMLEKEIEDVLISLAIND